jgi:hypothetical protein
MVKMMMMMMLIIIIIIIIIMKEKIIELLQEPWYDHAIKSVETSR